MSFIETAKYNVIQKFENRIELRNYPTLYLATTLSPIDKNYSGGFNNVFRYISGNNVNNEKISMTTPVVSTIVNQQLKTQFLVPSKFGSNPPQPSGNDVTIETLEEGVYLVIQFNGKWTEANFNQADSVLLSFIKQNNYTIQSERILLRYQGPMVPGFLRRNEIMYKIETL